MSARDDYPFRARNVPGITPGDRSLWEAMCDEIDRLRDERPELVKYATLLAEIMSSPDDRAAVQEAAEHVWRVSLTTDEHERLARFASLGDDAL